jgi:4-oxalocrotonate tautomerase
VPHVIVKLWPGEESESNALEEIRSQDWADKVYRPDIQAKPDQLYKKPGYGLENL